MITELLNTLFVQTQGAYLHLDHDTIRVEAEGELKLQMPLQHLGGIAVFGNVLLSPYLIHRCAADGRELTWFDHHGEFQARLQGPVTGNVLLRKAQHDAQGDPQRCVTLARSFVEGKIRNSRAVLQRAERERSESSPRITKGEEELSRSLRALERANSLEEVRGIEGQAAAAYFGAFSEMILEDGFPFSDRNRRPPRDTTNALLSFVYALLLHDCVAAVEGIGLDPQVGYLHALRPGRPGLGLDLMEEFRSWFADRLVLTLINRRQLEPGHFEQRPGGAVFLDEKGRREVIVAFQKRKQETLAHPLLKQQVQIGLLPHIQARLLARYIRGDLLRYVAFLPK